MIERAQSRSAGPSRIQPGEETAFDHDRASFERRPQGLHLHAPVSTVVHVETILGRPHGENANRHAVTVAGNLHLPELRCEIAIRGKARLGNRGEPEENHRASATIVRRHFAMPIPLQCLDSPTRERGDLWVLTPTADRDPRWIEHYAGQLNGEPLTLDYHVPVAATLDVTFTPGESENGGWSDVDVSGELRFLRPASIRLRFRDARKSIASSLESQGDEVVLIAVGSRVPIRQTMPSPAGRDAWLTVRVIEAETRVIRVDQLLSESPVLD